MIEGLLAIGVAVWFYRIAGQLGRDPLLWAVIGAVVFYGTVLLWTIFNKTAFMEQLHHQSLALGVFVHYLGSVLGLLAVWLTRKLGLR
ncbi:MAG: hypothetical protein N3A55_00700 [Methylohalobius sp.]|nr:hypothetical protein [Methylohalobius sp.]